jgi:uncharacterized protein YndB with AHSA1/START domain
MSREIVKETVVRATTDAVWRALTEADELRRWFPVDARVAPGIGGSIWLSWGAGAEAEAPITGWDPPRHFQWTEPRGPIKLAIDFHIEAQAGGMTRVRLVQSGFGDGPDWDDEFHMLTGGWSYFIAHLHWYLERHRGVPRDLIAFRDEVSLSRPDAFERLCRALATIDTVPLVESRHTQQMGVRVPALNDALIFVEMEPHSSGCRAGFWVSTYGLPRAQLDAARDRFDRLYHAALGSGAA